MSKITASPNISQVAPDQAQRFIDQFCQDVVNTVNGGLDFGSNFNGIIVQLSFNFASTDILFNHKLGRTPTGFIIMSSDQPFVVYKGSTAFTDTVINLRASVPGTATVFLF